LPAEDVPEATQPAPLQTLEELAGEDGPYALPDAVEPPYSQVAAHIEQTLIGLLDDLSLPERHKAQALEMRERVARGLNWYELIPVLDDLAVLMLAITDSGQHEFEAYLQQLNERLESFQSHLHEASTGHADNSSAPASWTASCASRSTACRAACRVLPMSTASSTSWKAAWKGCC
jgi:diguanylate cyclase